VRINRDNFPFIALALSVPLLAALVVGAQPTADGGIRFPLLTLLAISEFGLLINLGAAWLVIGRLIGGERETTTVMISIGSLLFAVAFAIQLIRLWPL
jgi:hypothetical protein